MTSQLQQQLWVAVLGAAGALFVTTTAAGVWAQAQAPETQKPAQAKAAPKKPEAQAPAAPAAASEPAQTEEGKPTVSRELPSSAEGLPRVLSPTTGGLTADQVAARALASSHSVRAKQAQLRAANAKIQQTTVTFFPTLKLSASYTRLSPVSVGFGSGALVGAQNAGALSTGPCQNGMGTCVLDSQGEEVQAASVSITFPENYYALSASLVVPLSDYVTRLSHAAAAARASRDAARLNVEAEKLKVASEARILFYGWTRALAQASVAEKSLDRSRALLKDAEVAFTLGTISKSDLLRLRALVKGAELSLMQAKTQETLFRSRLGLVMDAKKAESNRFMVGENVSAPPSHSVEGQLAELVTEAQGRRLELRALGQTARALHRGASAMASTRLPRIDALGDITHANPNQRFFPPAQEWNTSWSVGVAATWTVNDLFTGGARSEELEQNASEVEANRAALRQGIEEEVTAAFLERNNARAAIATAVEARRASEEAYRVAKDLYRVGRATTTELIEAEAELVRALSSQLDAQIALRMAETRLWHATGRDEQARAK